MNPVVEANVPLIAGAGVNANGKDDEADDGHNLDAGKPHFELAIPADRQEVNGGEYDPEDGDEDGDTEAGVPVLDDEAGGGQLEGKGDGPAEPVDPAHREAERGVHKARRVDSEGAGHGNEGGHLAQTRHDGEDDAADEDESDQGANGPGRVDSLAASQEQTRAYSAADGEELQMMGLQAALQLGAASLDVLAGAAE